VRRSVLQQVMKPWSLVAAAMALASASIAANIAQGGASASPPATASAAPASLTETAEKFEQLCAGCHGAGGVSGDRAPALANSAKLRAMSDAEIGAIIRNGLPGGMPPFAFDDPELARFVALIRSKNQVARIDSTPEQVAAGEALFFGQGECSSCHMVRGRGGSNGPDLSLVADRSTVSDMAKMLDDPTAMMGARTTASCPGWAFCPDLQWSVVNVALRNGSTLRGFARNEAEHSLQLQTLDGRLRALSESEYSSYTREATSYMPPFKGSAEQRQALLAYLATLKGQRLGPIAKPSLPAPSAAEIDAVLAPRAGEWPSYNGLPSSNRHSAIDQINTGNVAQLKTAWTFGPGGIGLETTPVVMDGVMYVTGAKQLCALDARTGRSFWCAARTARQPLPAGGIAEQQRSGPSEPSAAVSPAAGARPSAGATAPIAVWP
jgi:mono/diheme cytochrome c family protein